MRQTDSLSQARFPGQGAPLLEDCVGLSFAHLFLEKPGTHWRSSLASFALVQFTDVCAAAQAVPELLDLEWLGLQNTLSASLLKVTWSLAC